MGINFIPKKMEELSKMLLMNVLVLDMKMFEKSLVTHGVNESRGGPHLGDYCRKRVEIRNGFYIHLENRLCYLAIE